MQYHIKLVNGAEPQMRRLLRGLQKVCLPSDTVYDTSSGFWWVAYTLSGVPIAFAGIVRSKSWVDCGYLCRAGVIPNHRGQGLQKRLIRVRLKKAKELGWNWVITDTHENPASANSLIAARFKMYEPAQPWGITSTLYWRYKVV